MNKQQCEQIKGLISGKGLSIATVASELGMSYSGLSAVLNGVTAPSTSLMSKMLEFLGVSPVWVMTGCGEMTGGDAVRISEQLKIIMEERSLTGYKVSQLTGVSPSMVSHLLAGKRPLSERDLMRLSAGLGVNPYWLLTGKGGKEVAPQPQTEVERLREENERLRAELEKERERMRQLIAFAGSLLK